MFHEHRPMKKFPENAHHFQWPVGQHSPVPETMIPYQHQIQYLQNYWLSLAHLGRGHPAPVWQQEFWDVDQIYTQNPDTIVVPVEMIDCSSYDFHILAGRSLVEIQIFQKHSPKP